MMRPQPPKSLTVASAITMADRLGWSAVGFGVLGVLTAALGTLLGAAWLWVATFVLTFIGVWLLMARRSLQGWVTGYQAALRERDGRRHLGRLSAEGGMR